MKHLVRPGIVGLQRAVKRRRLAIVTTYDELCGIAGYSRCLVRALEPHLELEVFDLDQFLLRQTDSLGRRKADRHFKQICRRLASFDIVNLQLEFGTLGATEKDIFRRLSWLCKAAPALSIDFHTVPRRGAVDWERVLGFLRHLRFSDAINEYYSGNRTTAKRTYNMLRRYARFRPLKLIVHTRRDRRYLEIVQDFKDVHDHPLSFLQLDDVARVLAESKRNPFGSVVKVPEGCKSIGVFGFLSAYKGFETAIRALRYLPANHHLYIFGGVHPNDIPERRISSYVQQLMREVTIDHTLLDRLVGLASAVNTDAPEAASFKDNGARVAPVHVSLQSAAEAHNLVEGLVDSLVSRVHFVGALSDDQFWVAMASCDVVVLPYHEVMQSSSGPASLAIELGCRTLLSRTRGFLQLSRYFPNRLEYFDVGNHLQLVSLLKEEPATEIYPARPVSMETLCRMYVGIHGGTAAEPAEAMNANGHADDASVELLPRPAEREVPMGPGGVNGSPEPEVARAEKKLAKRLFKRGLFRSPTALAEAGERTRPLN